MPDPKTQHWFMEDFVIPLFLATLGFAILLPVLWFLAWLDVLPALPRLFGGS